MRGSTARSRNTDIMRLLPIEARLFLLSVKPRGDGDDERILRLLGQQVDWQSFARLAERERLVSVMWRRLRPIAGVVPSDVAIAFDRETALTEFKMAVTSAVLDRLVKRLAEAGIPPMLLKGAALARSVYPSFMQRPMNDLDLLVPSALAGTASALLRADGWTLECEEILPFHADFHHLPPLVDPSPAHVVLELHHTLAQVPGPFVFDESRAWRDARSVRSGSCDAWIPSDEQQLLHLCVHYAWSHSLDRGLARTVRDISTLLGCVMLDWDAFVSLAVGARASTCAYWTLALSKTLADATVPDAVLETLRPRQLAATTRALERAFIASALFELNPSRALGRWLWTAGMQPRRSKHGSHRPWDSTARFHEAIHSAERPSVATRLTGHAHRAGAWLRFARLAVSSDS